MKIIKRDGSEQTFSKSNIYEAISKANQKVKLEDRFTNNEIKDITKAIEEKCKAETHAINVEDIQEMVEDAIIMAGKSALAKEYITYRYMRALERQKNTTDDKILSLLDNDNEEIKQENANKNPTILNVQRDYMAGEVSKDISRRYLIPEDIYRAHQEGIIHFHDMDYFANHMHNCCLVNLEDMLQNGTVLRGRQIVKPHKFSTACNIATQIAAAVCSSQYGGQTFNVAHLSVFVEESRKTFEKKYAQFKETMGEEAFKAFIDKMVDEDIIAGVQTLNYQLNTLVGTNGQAPFISFGMYLDDVPEGIERDNLARVIEEIFIQRIQGLPNEQGVFVTQEFPKLLYMLDEDNIHDDSPYFWLTKKAAECTSKRMVPDYISAKKMRELKDGNVFPSMGCVYKDSIVKIKLDSEIYTIAFDKLYELVMGIKPELGQYSEDNPNKYIDTSDIDLYVFDSNKSDFVKVKKLMKNIGSNLGWKHVILSDGHSLICTENHIISTNKSDEIEVQNITDDKLYVSQDNKLVECDIAAINDIIITREYIDNYNYSYDMETESGHFDVNGIYTHNCRSFLQPYYEDKNGNPTSKKRGKPKFWGRFNQGVVTLNLPDVALCAKGDMEKFWLLLDDRLELCHRALRLRHERLRGTLSDVAPEMWQGGALARLKPGETIDKLLYNDYSSISLGYVGLCECVTALIGRPHYADDDAKELGKAIMARMNEKCEQWKQIEKIGYSIYGTPEESTTYKFAKALQKRHGIIPGVTDKNYVTNSYHVHVTQEINAFDKLSIESEFQALSKGGAISYVEADDITNNLDAVIDLLRHMYETIMYAEINLHLSYCKKCGYHGRLEMPSIDGKIIWRCPACGCIDQDLLHATVRVCGYIASNTFNQGRMQEIEERVTHF